MRQNTSEGIVSSTPTTPPTNRSITIQEVASAGLAYLLVGGAIAYSLIALTIYHLQNVAPDWLTLGVGAALGFYFGNRASTTATAQATNGLSDAIVKGALAAQMQALSAVPPLPPEPPDAKTS
jgi:hypothetical protein